MNTTLPENVAANLLVRKVPSVAARVAIKLTPISETLIAHVALERSFAFSIQIRNDVVSTLKQAHCHCVVT